MTSPRDQMNFSPDEMTSHRGPPEPLGDVGVSKRVFSSRQEFSGAVEERRSLLVCSKEIGLIAGEGKGMVRGETLRSLP